LQGSERPLRATGPVLEKITLAVCFEALYPEVGETGLRGAEKRNAQLSRSRGSVPCMPVMSQAVSQLDSTGLLDV